MRRLRHLPPPQRTALLSVLAAALLVAIKLGTGLATGSLGLIAEAVHSGTDLVAAVLTVLAVRVAVRPADREHPYGHGKAEHLAALAEAMFLVLASAFIAWKSVDRLASGASGEVDAAWYAIGVLVLVLVVDASRATMSWRAAQRYSSAALAANALHFASDLLGSLAVLAGLLLVRAGVHEADSIAALIVAVLVVAAAVRLMRENVNVLMDRAPAGAEEKARAAIVAAEPDVELRRLRIRQAAGRHFADVVIGMRPDAALGQGHAVADAIEEAVRTAVPGADVVVHVEPGEQVGDLRERASAAALSIRGVSEVHNVRLMQGEGGQELSLHLKTPRSLPLEAAHAIASDVERAIHGAVPEIAHVQTHIEPLAPTRLAVAPDSADLTAEARAVRAVVREMTHEEPRDLRLRRGEQGIVALITVALPAHQSLAEAHATATEIERRVRAAAPDIADVVVHTEPRD